MTKVHFTRDTGLLYSTLEDTFRQQFNPGDEIAVKLHMGEKGNTYFLQPTHIKPILNILLGMGVKPFLFDSLTVYQIARHTVDKYKHTAANHGYSPKKIGCPVRISNEATSFSSGHLEIGVCKDLIQADGVLVLSHVKTHPCTGFGATIKNIGMGAVNRETKQRIHDGGKPKYLGGCSQCGMCVDRCPFENIGFKENEPQFNRSHCAGCSICIGVCPQHVLVPRVALFDHLIAEAASIAFENFRNSYFVNFFVNIADRCDCAPGGIIITGDVGFLHSEDPVAIDAASYDLLKEREGRCLFEERTHKSPLLHINHAAHLGMGSTSYTLISDGTR